MSDRVPDLWDPVWRQEYLARFKQQRMIMGPKNTDELRELLTSRQFPNDPKSQQLQTPSDRMREKALAFGEVLYGLVPDLEFHAFAGNVLHDLVILGEAKLCELREVKATHAPTRELRAATPMLSGLSGRDPGEVAASLAHKIDANEVARKNAAAKK